MIYYENVVIFDALLSDDEINAQVEKTKALLEQFGAKIVKIDIWGRRRLTFPIKKRRDGFFAIYYFTVSEDKKAIAEVEKRYRISEAILRYMIIKLEPHESAIVLKDILQSEKKEAAEAPKKAEEAKPQESKAPEASSDKTEANPSAENNG